ncbi:serpin family protein [Alkalibacter rhizosphaerae]|uniref:Serpin family protein n=1 Tax=Alkalibacter rhizosphaerae TaxID=2815577 RepID=A0A974XGA9_9FIRM|nr:serpin family protein [Alkalibacter rhizosphaerae]QSX08105.1 serpin family protein [Alkalibacter rhizosphaerae]
MIRKHTWLRRLVLLAILVVAVPAMLLLTSCGKTASPLQATDLMKGFEGKAVSGKSLDEDFLRISNDFYMDLLKSASSSGENVFISPLSVHLALSMTANGAQGNTLDQMEELLGREHTISDMNGYLLEYTNNLPTHEKSKLSIANSIWFRDDEDRLQVEDAFLQTNADYYNASAYAAPFDETTVTDINNWVENKTDGLIDKIIEQIEEDTIMYLINAMVFDAEWETIYREEQVREDTFTNAKGEEQQVPFMNSEENIYLENDHAMGFVKLYAQGDYAFFALLPKEGSELKDLIETMDGDELSEILNHPQETLVTASMPKFSYAYEWKMNDPLKALGMVDAFDNNLADFSRLGHSSRGNIYVGEVLHKTFIQVDEKGTKAGAVTKVEIKDESYVETKIVDLDRPFLFGIMDRSTNLPIFLGTLTEIEQD